MFFGSTQQSTRSTKNRATRSGLAHYRTAAEAPFGAQTASCKPNLRKMTIAGHQFVSPDWKRFNPTNAVNSNHQGLTQCAKATDNTTKNPANSLNARSTVIRVPPKSSTQAHILVWAPEDVCAFQPCSKALALPYGTAASTPLHQPSTTEPVPGK